MLGSGGADEHRVVINPDGSKRARVRTNLGCEANNFKCDDLVDDKTGDVGQSKTMRGKNKCECTHGERKVLLECFVRRSGKKTGIYKLGIQG